MSEGVALLTYLWHYLVARLFYDDLLRPLLGDRGAILGLIVAAVVLTLVLRAGARRTK